MKLRLSLFLAAALAIVPVSGHAREITDTEAVGLLAAALTKMPHVTEYKPGEYIASFTAADAQVLAMQRSRWRFLPPVCTEN